MNKHQEEEIAPFFDIEVIGSNEHGVVYGYETSAGHKVVSGFAMWESFYPSLILASETEEAAPVKSQQQDILIPLFDTKVIGSNEHGLVCGQETSFGHKVANGFVMWESFYPSCTLASKTENYNLTNFDSPSLVERSEKKH
jgi:hypothetical protein